MRSPGFTAELSLYASVVNYATLTSSNWGGSLLAFAPAQGGGPNPCPRQFCCGGVDHSTNPPTCNGDCCSNKHWCCDDGTCCDPPDQCCADASGFRWCTGVQNDPNNCGRCDNVCPPGPPNSSPTCTNSVCGFACDAGFFPCAGGCCSSCPPPNKICNGVCTDIRGDSSNCGACGNVCAPNTSCCSGTCSDLTSDPNNCGDCGAPCPPGTCCAGGSGCCPDSSCCGNGCCAVGDVCCGGQCCAGTCCGGKCCSGSCCGSGCCPAGTFCCGPRACCPTGSVCCGSGCCPAGKRCVLGLFCL